MQEPTQLWDVWLSKLSNQNHAAYLMAKFVGANGCSHFSFLFFARENERSLDDGKRGWPKKENNCNDVCRDSIKGNQGQYAVSKQQRHTQGPAPLNSIRHGITKIGTAQQRQAQSNKDRHSPTKTGTAQ